jgi:ectoine hydroxylase-related dioxygenase (phytanoyl-CoA dioxygenase family)
MQTHVEHYQKTGYTMPVDVFSRAETMAMRRLFFETINQSEENTNHISKEIANWHAEYEWCRDIVCKSQIVDLVQHLLDTEDIMVWSMLFWYKSVGDLTYVPWHQDGMFWAMKPSKTITAWLAIGDVDDENGALHFLPGRRTELRTHEPLKDGQSEFIIQCPTYEHDGKDNEVVVDMLAGQACLFDARTIHRTGPNLSSSARLGCAIRYATPDVKFDSSKWQRYRPKIFMLRGQDRHHLNPAFMAEWPA